MSVTAEQDWLLGTSSVTEFFAELGVHLPARGGAEAEVSCFANPEGHKRGDRTPSCSVSLLTGLWHCHGCGAKGNPYQAAQALGRSDRQAAEMARRYRLFINESREEKVKGIRLPSELQLRKWRDAMRTNDKVLRRLWKVRGWTEQAIYRTGLGWDGERIVMTVRDPRLKRIGVARYLPGGDPKMVSLPGSKRGLWPAPEVCSRKRPLFLVEGEPAAVAVWSTGHQAIAIPGAASWKADWARRLWERKLVMLPDCDAQGRALAERVAGGTGARIVDVEPGRDDGYDIGDWVREAAHEGGLGQVHHVLGRLAA